MNDKERFLMKLLFEYDWKKAFPDMQFNKKIEVYYPKRLFCKFMRCDSGNIYDESNIAKCALMNMRIGDKIPYWKDGKKGFAEVVKITEKTAFFDYNGEQKKLSLNENKFKAMSDLSVFLGQFVKGIYYNWENLYDLKEMIERDDAISIDKENQVYMLETATQFQLRIILEHFLGVKVEVNRHYKQPLHRHSVGESFEKFAERTTRKKTEEEKKDRKLDVGFRVYKLKGDTGDKVATG